MPNEMTGKATCSSTLAKSSAAMTPAYMSANRVEFEIATNARTGKPQAVGVRLIKDQQEEAA